MQQTLEEFIRYISQPWPWWVGGLMIALILFILLWFGREFGISANFRVVCAMEGGDKYADFFKFDWQSQMWNLIFVAGAMFGGNLAYNYLPSPDGHVAHVTPAAVETFHEMGVEFEGRYPPLVPDYFSWSSLFTLKGIIILVLGGLLVGFGARYAGGCTSGHAISGLSALQLPSLIAVIGFFLGGLVANYLILPWLLKL